jgi:hypothetical protein
MQKKVSQHGGAETRLREKLMNAVRPRQITRAMMIQQLAHPTADHVLCVFDEITCM